MAMTRLTAGNIVAVAFDSNFGISDSDSSRQANRELTGATQQ